MSGLDPWNSANVLAPLLIGVGLAILLAIHQWKFRTDGLFARHIFSKSRNPAIVLVAVAIEGAGMLFWPADDMSTNLCFCSFLRKALSAVAHSPRSSRSVS
jgi:hypothetical protein